MRSLATWKPVINLFDIHSEMNHVFDNVFGGTLHRAETRRWDWAPAVDISEVGDNVEIRAEIPGVSEEDVHVSVTDDVLTLRGEKKQDSSEDRGSFHRVERSYGSFQRTFTLPKDLQTENITATFKNGVLTVSIPKAEKAKPKEIEIITE